jgi:type III restriction enzyme
VAETKADTSEEQLRRAELQSIDSAECYFRDVAPGVTFKKIEGFDQLMEAIS